MKIKRITTQTEHIMTIIVEAIKIFKYEIEIKKLKQILLERVKRNKEILKGKITFGWSEIILNLDDVDVVEVGL